MSHSIERKENSKASKNICEMIQKAVILLVLYVFSFFSVDTRNPNENSGNGYRLNRKIKRHSNGLPEENSGNFRAIANDDGKDDKLLKSDFDSIFDESNTNAYADANSLTTTVTTTTPNTNSILKLSFMTKWLDSNKKWTQIFNRRHPNNGTMTTTSTTSSSSSSTEPTKTTISSLVSTLKTSNSSTTTTMTTKKKFWGLG
ncbi:uncharacterized protein LOC128964000 [Oppia nitens]|uniref:uncharacterized protein LOC128964000 n=1 Tax=Oppia nitens TaxID=1686743 RepID=UPI0023DAE42D|nr:uncharacterized protein LOC128964000 [Oppia nitens]